MKKLSEYLTESVLRKILIGILAICTIFIMIVFSLPFSEYDLDLSIWNATKEPNVVVMLNSIFMLIGFITNIILLLSSVIILVMKKLQYRKVIIANIALNIILIFILFIVNLFMRLYTSNLGFVLVFNIILNGIAAGSLFLYLQKNEVIEQDSSEKEQSEFGDSMIRLQQKNKLKYLLLIFDVLSVLSLLLILFVPVATRDGIKLVATSVLGRSGMTLDVYILSIAIVVLFLISLLYFIFTISTYLSENKKYFQKSKILQTLNLIIAALFFLTGLVLVFVYQIKQREVSTIAFIPFLIQMFIYFGYSFLIGKIFENKLQKLSLEDASLEHYRKRKLKILPLIFVMILTMIIFSSLFFVLIKTRVVVTGSEIEVTSFKGLDLLKNYFKLNEVYQMLAFIYVVILSISGLLLLFSIVHYLVKSIDYYKVIKGTVYVNILFSSIFALIGLFFILNKKSTEVHIKTLLEQFGMNWADVIQYTVRSESWVIFLMAIIVLLLAIITKQLQYRDDVDGFAALVNGIPDGNLNKAPRVKAKDKREELNELANKSVEEFDACPAFSDIDSKKDLFDTLLRERRENLFADLTLPNLVDFVVSYAANSRLHLSYTLEDIATFIAGLGTSRLAILQGMSGTGKTSLPKIFSEALMGNVEIIEVESSWRDKNELLGYFNEFSQVYTPKKFTQSLYRAKLNSDVLTFIVLDEMNLSRIEYYFSDFLSLMEAEEDKREIKLLNVKLFKQEQEELLPYLGLKDGHTIEIPKNVWFIGTANRDESTFEISDKVYDRAQTMNFNKRAPKIRFYSEEMEPRFITYEMLNKLFQDAKMRMDYDAENDTLIKEVERLLIPYNISFGNRILNHIESFVKIYCACFINTNIDQEVVLKEAVETIVFSKVVSKLEFKHILNKEKLAAAFDKLNLLKCSSFVRSLSED